MRALEFEMVEREEAMAALKELYRRGYRFVTRDDGYRTLMCFSVKPRKYPDTGWGYVNPDGPESLMAYPIRNMDIMEISPDDRSAKRIADFLKGSEFDVS